MSDKVSIDFEVYPIKIVEKHIIALINNKNVLIDTGSPCSVGAFNQLTLMNKTFRLYKNYLGLEVDKLSKFIGSRIDVLLGGDILSKFFFCINWNTEKIQFSSSPIVSDVLEIPLNFYMDIPIIELKISNRDIKTFLDTGAKLSYLDPDITSNYKIKEEKTDFYHLIGEFNTPVYKIPVIFANRRFIFNFGNLPELLQTALRISNVEGILGNEIFLHYSICFDYRRKKLILKEIISK